MRKETVRPEIRYYGYVSLFIMVSLLDLLSSVLLLSVVLVWGEDMIAKSQIS